MKQILSMFVALLLVFSAVPVFADSGSDDSGSDDSSDDMNDDDSYDDSHDGSDDDSMHESDVRLDLRLRQGDDDIKVRNELRVNADGTRLEVREEMREKREDSMDARQERREEIKMKIDGMRLRIEEARKNIVEVREDFREARDKYQERREVVVDARTTLRECKGDDSQECVDARAKIKAEAKPFLADGADMVLNALNELAARIEASDLDDEAKEKRLAEIDLQIEHILSAKATIEGLDENATAEDIRAASKEIQEAWVDSKTTIKKQTGHAVNERLKHVYDQLVKIGDRLDAAIAKLEEKGYDVSESQEMMVDFQAHLDLAEQYHAEARVAYENADGEQTQAEAIKAGNELVRKAHSELKLAREMLRDIIHSIKATDASVDLSADVDAEAQAEVSA